MTSGAAAAVATTPVPAAGSAGRTVAEQLLTFLHDTLGCDRLFTVPGEAFLPLLGHAGRAGVELVTSRHEAGAALCAVADARLRGGPAVVAVNRSPGATNASIALDAARADPTPLLLIVGGPRRGTDPVTGFQGTDLTGFLGGLAPVFTVPDGPGLAGVLEQVAALLTRPEPSPVSLIVPEDVFADQVPEPDGDREPVAGRPAGGTEPGGTGAGDLVRALTAAQRPVLIAGQLLRVAGGPGPEVAELLARFAEHSAVPVLAGNKQQDLMDNRHPGYAGHLHLGSPQQLRDRLAQADLVVFLGGRPDEVQLAHWYAGHQLAVHAEHPLAVLRELAGHQWPAASRDWQAGWQELAANLATPRIRTTDDGLDFALVARELDARLPDGAVLTLDAGHFSSWVHRYVRLRPGQRLLALASGAMGFGVPAAVAAVLRDPAATAVAVVGDGGLLMTGNELAVARAAGRAPVVIVADNASYGTIRDHQARYFPDSDCGTGLANPDFVAWAGAFGVPGERVERPEQVGPALGRALDSPDGYLVHVRTSLQAVHANHELPRDRQA
ncbi:thiamine pyrophosphate-dependent enzyme [Jatrophihabitans sp.]|uniref:thiamine pyrophosphate-dependent enzyme n=1 Tax=Jatrophihabitans sp. TaxID=1932789 RepID=UPI002C77E21F|nr:thiamine pyrophosphate-dependent enzyme [Jatrophihabitans sp.]